MKKETFLYNKYVSDFAVFEKFLQYLNIIFWPVTYMSVNEDNVTQQRRYLSISGKLVMNTFENCAFSLVISLLSHLNVISKIY